MELKGNIRVFCRVRPMLASDVVTTAHPKKGNHGTLPDNHVFVFPDYHHAKRKIVLVHRHGHHSYVAHHQQHVDPQDHSHSHPRPHRHLKKHVFEFDQVFDPTATQSDMFAEVASLVQSAMDGYKVAIFAYGQTGSGKTYTMLGGTASSSSPPPCHPNDNENENDDDDDAMCGPLPPPCSSSSFEDSWGIVRRTMSLVFELVAAQEASGWYYIVTLEMVEIYNEKMRDLTKAVVRARQS
jgi:kinesin family protein C1